MLRCLGGLIPAMALKDRILEIVGAGYTKAAIARAAGKSSAAVKSARPFGQSDTHQPPPTGGFFSSVDRYVCAYVFSVLYLFKKSLAFFF